ncbi:hypothetical protein [Couchioplanes caeruleus]|uniref:Uncharacterized protein n=1 Tax=Couchioplanes caeruleus TaxID=56438 RepID=A0A3N1GKH6_9ACTN|nr:hypothetical protein [Couchioplanes caeruleus]ROP30671.1 hypothetical protein EDD30_3529 [Couchioplanes caeruleus]
MLLEAPHDGTPESHSRKHMFTVYEFTDQTPAWPSLPAPAFLERSGRISGSALESR